MDPERPAEAVGAECNAGILLAWHAAGAVEADHGPYHALGMVEVDRAPPQLQRDAQTVLVMKRAGAAARAFSMEAFPGGARGP